VIIRTFARLVLQIIIKSSSDTPINSTSGQPGSQGQNSAITRAMDIEKIYGKRMVVKNISNLSNILELNADGTVSIPNDPLFVGGNYLWTPQENAGEATTDENNEFSIVSAVRFTASLEFAAKPEWDFEARQIELTADVDHFEDDDTYLSGQSTFMRGEVSGDIQSDFTNWSATITPRRPFTVLGFDDLTTDPNLQFYEASYDAENALGYVNLGEFWPSEDQSLDISQVLNENTFNYYLVAAQGYTEIQGIRVWEGEFATFANFIVFESTGIGYGGNTNAGSILLEPSDQFFEIYGRFGLPEIEGTGLLVDTYAGYIAIKR